MRRIVVGLLVFLMLCSPSCAVGATVTDVFGSSYELGEGARVVSLYASFAECWLLSGGVLVGVTEDAVSEHALEVGKDVEIVGTVKHADLERVVALNPDYVILSADLAAHVSLKSSLDVMGIPCGYFRMDVFEDYRKLMEQFCEVNGRADLYEENVLDVEQEIAQIKERIPESDCTVLLIRAFSTGMKAKSDDNLAGQILREFGLYNIAEQNESILEDLSLEQIVKSDPDYIFAVTMGNEEGARAYLEDHVLANPAWRSLTAVQRGRYHLLPKELFHYKPNNRWSESYEYLAKLIWPETFED